MYLTLLLVTVKNTISPHPVDFYVSFVPVLVSRIAHKCGIKKRALFVLFYFIQYTNKCQHAKTVNK